MKPLLPLILLPLLLSGCMVRYTEPTELAPAQPAPQDRLVQPGPADSQVYWDALDNVPGARTGEADYYYSHRGGGGHP